MQYLSILSLFVFLLSGCVQPNILHENKQVVQNAGTLSILMYDDSKLKHSYRVYINHKDINSLLLANGITEYKIRQGKINIQVVKKRETASINLVIQKDKRYTLKVIEDEKGHIELLQVANNVQE